MKNTTLCYILRGDEVLMLHRTAKQNDENEGKWIGVGGKMEANESPDDCLLREVREETGLRLTRWRYRGILTFVSDRWEGEYMHQFTADGFEGGLPQWEGDRIFLSLLEQNAPFFSLKLCYEGDRLARAVLDGKELSL